MTHKKNFSKELLEKLYIEEKLTTFQIAEKFRCCQATVWKKLKFFDIKLRLPGINRVNLTKEHLKDMYINKKLSTWQIKKYLKFQEVRFIGNFVNME